MQGTAASRPKEENLKETCLIISGGDYHELPEEYKREAPAFIIACDQGWQYAMRMGLKPDLVVGDFDSAAPPGFLPVMQVPSRKDDTDTMLAIKEALKRGYRHLALLCAFGGRLDHSLANIQAGAYAALRGTETRLYGIDTWGLISAGPADHMLPRREGWSLSLFSLSERCRGISIQGTKYEGEELALESSFPLGVSNVWKEAAARIRIREGILLILESKLKKGEHI